MGNYKMRQKQEFVFSFRRLLIIMSLCFLSGCSTYLYQRASIKSNVSFRKLLKQSYQKANFTEDFVRTNKLFSFVKNTHNSNSGSFYDIVPKEILFNSTENVTLSEALRDLTAEEFLALPSFSNHTREKEGQHFLYTSFHKYINSSLLLTLRASLDLFPGCAYNLYVVINSYTCRFPISGQFAPPPQRKNQDGSRMPGKVPING